MLIFRAKCGCDPKFHPDCAWQCCDEEGNCYYPANIREKVFLEKNGAFMEVREIADLHNRVVFFKSFHNTYLRAFPTGAKVDMSPNKLLWEEWVIIPIQNNKYFFRSVWGTNLRAYPEGKLDITPNTGTWEQWRIVPKDSHLGEFHLVSFWGKYLRGYPGHGAKLDITPNHSTWETWKIEPKI
jgi:hypothetical protein